MSLVSGIYNILGLQWNLVFTSTLWCREFNIPTHLWLQWLLQPWCKLPWPLHSCMPASVAPHGRCPALLPVPHAACPLLQGHLYSPLCAFKAEVEKALSWELFFWNNIAQRLRAISNSAFKWICLVTPWRSPWMGPCLRLSYVPQH